MNKQNIIIKLSGAALKDSNNDSILSGEKLSNLAKQLITLSKKYNIGIIVGGGNIWRGQAANAKLYDLDQAHYMGMLATVINSIALKEVLKRNKAKAIVYSLIDMPKVASTYNLDNVKEHLQNGYICIMAGGTGSPFFSTDTGAALHAAEIGAKCILVGKDGVDGVYSADPKKNKNAKRFDHLTYDEIIKRDLKVMDMTSITFCKANCITLIVFNNNQKDGIIKAINKQTKVTVVENK